MTERMHLLEAQQSVEIQLPHPLQKSNWMKQRIREDDTETIWDFLNSRILQHTHTVVNVCVSSECVECSIKTDYICLECSFIGPVLQLVYVHPLQLLDDVKSCVTKHDVSVKKQIDLSLTAKQQHHSSLKRQNINCYTENKKEKREKQKTNKKQQTPSKDNINKLIDKNNGHHNEEETQQQQQQPI